MIPSIKNMFVAPFQNLDMMELFRQAIQIHEQDIIAENESQLDEGIDANSQTLGDYKNFAYKNRFRPVDLFLTGAFRSKFFIVVHDTYAEINSTDEKTGKLMDKYGENIFGISKKNQHFIAEAIKPILGNLIKKELYAST